MTDKILDKLEKMPENAVAAIGSDKIAIIKEVIEANRKAAVAGVSPKEIAVYQGHSYLEGTSDDELQAFQESRRSPINESDASAIRPIDLGPAESFSNAQLTMELMELKRRFNNLVATYYADQF